MNSSKGTRWPLRRRPLDWQSGAGRAPAAVPQSIDVIIPVYGAPHDLRRCLASVFAQTDLTRHRLVLVVDGPQGEEVESVLASALSSHPAIRLLRNDSRLGFVGSVNRGMSASTSDVVLLNSDTVVTPRWVEKLIEAAQSTADAGTVTPLSNHATLCSVPRAFEENLLPNGFTAATFSDLIEKISERQYPPLPTAVGVCMYIRRALLDDIGLFDAEHFGLGYGEENDFCMRALERGWLHLTDDATFIEHAGHRSFGGSRVALQRRALSTLQRLHPRYMATIAEFMRLDPLSGVRARIDRALCPTLLDRSTAFPGRVVHLVHGWPPFQNAGTELYASWLVQAQRSFRRVAVYTRGADPQRRDGEAVEWSDGGVRVRIVTNNFRARNPLRRNAIADPRLERDFERFLLSERPELLHVHHLAGHSFSLMRVARRLRLPIVLQLQDWWFLCARVNLYHRDGARCSGPAIGKCASCAPLTRVRPASFWNRLLHVKRRRAAREAIASADAYVVGSEAIKRDYLAEGLIPRGKEVHVIPYGVAVSTVARAAGSAGKPIRFGYVGSIAPHKGVHVAVEAMRSLDATEATLRVWGDDRALPDYTAALRRLAGSADVRIEGPFREEEKEQVFSSMDVLLVPSIGLESFGLSAREAMSRGVPVIASSSGALDEMFEKDRCGDFFPPGDWKALHALLRRVIDAPETVQRWSKNISLPKRANDHALEVEAIYTRVMKGRRS